MLFNLFFTATVETEGSVNGVTPKNLVKDLEKLIVKCNKAYREGAPLLSDAGYDSLLEELRKRSPGSSLLKKAIIEEAPKERKDTLPIPMPSLRKIKTFESLVSWMEKFYGVRNWIVTPKLDGLSVERDGKTASWSRGDGIIGQRCDKQCSFVKDYLKDPHYTRGEMIITNKVWEEEKDKTFAGKKHPRNTVGGLVTGDYKKGLPYRLMTYMGYDLFVKGKNSSKEEQINILNTTVNTVPMPYKVAEEFTEENLTAFYEEWKTQFPIDGLVIEVNEVEFRAGEESDGTPVYAVAYKPSSFATEGVTTILEVSRGINRWGVITPVIEIEPIELSGATISRVSGINMSYVKNWGLYEGQKVTIIRSGEVIPKIVEVEGIKIPFREDYSIGGAYIDAYNESVVERSKAEVEQSFTDDCPFCGAHLGWDKSEINQVCENKLCEEKIFQGVADFFLILGLENFSGSTLRAIYEEGYDSVQAILNITQEQLLGVEGFALKSVNAFIAQMERFRVEGVPLCKLLHASGLFPNLGSRTIQIILNAIKNDWHLATDKEFLSTIPGVAEITANTFAEGYKVWEKPKGIKVSYTYVVEMEEEIIEGTFTGERMCFTKCRPTGEEALLFKSNGGVLVDAVTSKTTTLVVKDLSETSTKTEKAKKLGIRILSYQQFKELLRV